MTVTNPYRERAMIPIESDMFFGREQEMRKIEEMLSGDRPQCVSIVGERRIGKSTLANRVFHKIKNDENTRAVYINCDAIDDDCKTKDRFFQLLNQAFCEAEREEQEGNLFDNYSSFNAFVKKQGGNGIKNIIFIDEFEHLPGHSFADDTFFSNLRVDLGFPLSLSLSDKVSRRVQIGREQAPPVPQMPRWNRQCLFPTISNSKHS